MKPLAGVGVVLVVVFGCLTTPTQGQACSSTKPCPTDACCSKWGNCGYGPDFCGSGCQNNCEAKPECGKWALESDCPLKVCCSKWGFCGTTEEFCNNECQGNCENPPKPSCSKSKNRPQLNIGYYASWAATRKCNKYTPENIEVANYTHLNYAFVDVRDGVIAKPSPEEDQNMRAFAGLKDYKPDLKILASVGGWAFNDPGPTEQEFHNIAFSEESRKRFILSVRRFLKNYNFDGIDIDWEYPVADDRGGHEEDKENYLELVKEMRANFKDKYLITIAAPASYWYLRHFKISEMSEYLDWINVMTYDIHGVWDANIESLGPYVKPHTDIMEIEPAIGLFRKDGVPDDKLVLGMGYYGRAFTLKDPKCTKIGCEFSGPANGGECTEAPGTLAWFEIVDIMKKNKAARTMTDKKSMTKVLVFDKDQWVGYDDEETLAFKRTWAKKNCMRGTMIWSIDQGLEKYEFEGDENDAVKNKIQPPKPDRSPLYMKPGPKSTGMGHG